MGLADRDYMRERAHARVNAVPVSPERVSKGAKFWWALVAVSVLCTLYFRVLPLISSLDFRQAVPFPSTGDVTVDGSVDPSSATSPLTVLASGDNAAVQLYTLSGHHVLTVYVRSDDRASTRVPPGTYRLRIAEGKKWYGPDRFFGNFMRFEDVVGEQVFTARRGMVIDLHRQIYGNLPTVERWARPKF